MSVEQLTKSQLVLLALLVSFVSSIASGIVTVTLMDQAPQGVTQTINQVVEHTVERVVPVMATQTAAAADATPVTTQQTVIVKESEAIADAVAAARPSLVRIVPAGAVDPAPIALGVAISASGIATDAALLKPGNEYEAELPGGGTVPLVPLSAAPKGPVVILAVATDTATETPSLAPITLSQKPLALGQTVIALSGLTSASIEHGLVTSVPDDGTAPTSLATDLALAPLSYGSIAIDAEGALAGIYTSTTGGFVPTAAFASSSTTARTKS
ncbi:MAG TPA: trypsin-like peptidase domain-containing protein [Candidatus Paceibacterota bacterium]|nr:trypsin-like peptidase domain-containing protein [Candidatus Paceibacterota bacterium]